MEVAVVSFEIFTFPVLTAVVVSLAIFACRFLLASFVFCFLFFWVLEGFIRYFCFLGKRQMQSHINGAD